MNLKKNDYGKGYSLKGWIINNLNSDNNRNLRDILTNILDSFILNEPKIQETQVEQKEESKVEHKEEPKEASQEPIINGQTRHSELLQKVSSDTLTLLTQTSIDNAPAPTSNMDELQELKQRFDNKEIDIEAFKRFIDHLSQANKFQGLRANIIRAIQKALTAQQSSSITLQVVATLAVVIFFAEFSKFDVNMKSYSQQSRDKAWRGNWVKQICQVRNIPQDNDKTKFSFENFFSTFQQFLPTVEDAQQAPAQ